MRMRPLFSDLGCLTKNSDSMTYSAGHTPQVRPTETLWWRFLDSLRRPVLRSALHHRFLVYIGRIPHFLEREE